MNYMLYGTRRNLFKLKGQSNLTAQGPFFCVRAFNVSQILRVPHFTSCNNSLFPLHKL